LIDQLEEPDILQKLLGFPKGVGLDLSKLILTGNSFGGMTAIGTSCLDNRIKVCLPYDPWFLPY
jgi:cephalosporin-C deacetylase-like acetyl esterase